MERLTIPSEKIPGGGTRMKIVDSRKVEKRAMEIYWRLKKYEDTGVEPEKLQSAVDHLRVWYISTKGLVKAVCGEILDMLGVDKGEQ